MKGMEFSPLESITLRGMLPRVFKGEGIPASEVWNSDLTFRRGESVLVEAASGGGKSSMCSYIYGARTDYEGMLLFNGRDVAGLDADDWQRVRRVNIAYLPQELSLFPELSAWDNIQLKNSLTDHAGPAQIEEWMRRLGILFRRDYPAGRMSIGLQQRVAGAELDEENNRIAAEIIAEEARRQGAGIISTSVGNHLLLDYNKRMHL